MGRFQATVSTVAALTTIAAAGATGWKLAHDQHAPDTTDKEITELRAKITQLESQPQTTVQPTAPPQPTVLPEPPVDSPPTVTPPQPAVP